MICSMSNNGPINKKVTSLKKGERNKLNDGTINEKKKSRANGIRKQLKDRYEAYSGHI